MGTTSVLEQEKKEKDKKINKAAVEFDFLNFCNRLASLITSKNNKNPDVISIHPPLSGIEYAPKFKSCLYPINGG
jgi:hypothetical protein